MNRFAAVLFPVTVPDEQTLVPLVQVFQPLVYCQPVEDGQEQVTETSLLRDELSVPRLSAVTFPAPLGENRERFLRLLHDLRHRGDDYAAQLSHLSLASMGTEEKEQETKGSILTNLLGRHGIHRQGPDKMEMLLWQARLILKLGEFVDEDQRHIRQEMEKITAKELGLLSDLRREPGYSPFSADGLYSPTPENNLQRLRMKAWARIFALGKESSREDKVFVTGSRDAFDRLVEEYERDTKQSPEPVIELVLPAIFPSSAQLAETMVQFDQAAAELIVRLNNLIDGAEPDPELREEWREAVVSFFPAEKHGQRELQLYSLKQVLPRSLFLNSFAHDEESRRMLTAEGDRRDIVIGILG